MKKITAVEASKPRSESAKIAGWVYTAILVVMALGQLYAFEKFIPLVAEYGLPGGESTATLYASLIVILEVLALPYLLRMRVSPLFRWMSLVCSVAIAGVWIKLALWAHYTDAVVENSGLLGTKVNVPVGAVSLLASVGLLALALYCAWGLWPVRTRKK
jgi:hypothetical protein